MRTKGIGKTVFRPQMNETHEVNTIKEILDYTTERVPDTYAYMYKNNHKEPFVGITWGDFREQMNALGTALLHRGFGGANIAVVGESSYRWVMSYFATVCGVGAIVPLDKHLMPEETVGLLKRADVQLIFADVKDYKRLRGCLDEVPTLKAVVLMQDEESYDEDSRVWSQGELIEEGRDLISVGHFEYIEAEVKPDDLSTILFTSGTTGLAKGVMLSHKNLAKNCENMTKFYQVTPGTRMLSILPIHHAYEMTCTYIEGCYNGATVVISEGLKYFVDNFVEAKCAIMLAVPLVYESIHKKIFKQAEKQGSAEKLNRGLRFSKKTGLGNSNFATKRLFKSIRKLFGDDLYTLIAGGAAIDPDVMEDFRAMGIPIIQGYGMTECAPIITMNPAGAGKDASAGIPLPGTEVRIVDQDEQGIGEIICKGPSVMLGYYKDPDATAETIKGGWLYTGDYGYLDSEGYVFITGRKKNVIVTKGGKNIFPEEIEQALLIHEEIAEAMVYGKENMLKEDLLCTALIYPNLDVLKEEGLTTDEQIATKIGEIIEEVNEKVPGYKRLKRFEVKDEPFVRTTTQKIKRFEEANYEYKYDSRTYDEGRRF